MKFPARLSILMIFLLSGCQKSIPHGQSGDALHMGSNLCKIISATNNLQVIDLEKREDKHERDTILEITHDGKAFFRRNYAFQNPDLKFSIDYAMSFESIHFSINGHRLTCISNEYFRLYSEGYMDGLYLFDYANYFVQSAEKEYLICRTYSANNSIAALHSLYFIIDITEPDSPQLYSLGSYGYCDNGIGDFNADGDLDIVLIKQDSIYDPPLNHYKPKGEFSAALYTLKDGEVLALEKEGQAIANRFKTHADSIELISGSTFDFE